MKIAHEAPLDIMMAVQSLTDYDYCLVHLLEESDEYKVFFRLAKMLNRKIIMDCSLFELGTAFNPELYYKWLLEIQPNEYIVPDVWQDAEANIQSFKDFSKNYDLTKLNGKKIGVLQGKTEEDFIKGYKFMNKHADKIAISFGYDFYLKGWEENIGSKASFFSNGRIQLIESLLAKKIINKKKPHHLLGCGLPTEFTHYKSPKYKFIESIDTSHPVMSGYYDKDYEDLSNLVQKIPQKMVDIFYQNVSTHQFLTIIKNIRIFRDLCLTTL